MASLISDHSPEYLGRLLYASLRSMTTNHLSRAGVIMLQRSLSTRKGGLSTSDN